MYFGFNILYILQANFNAPNKYITKIFLLQIYQMSISNIPVLFKLVYVIRTILYLFCINNY